MSGDAEDAARHARARSLFLAAHEIAAEKRDTFLHEACGGDDALRAEVESLLAHVRGPVPASGLTAASAGSLGDAPAVPVTIGPYRVVRPIGEGGMGVVYEARQEQPVRRTVALKLVKWGLDTAEVIARFDAERQALALMSHPNVARVIDAGATREGRPYFVMEFVEGAPITHYCDRHRLDLRARLELFLAVCAGVEHAHRNGLIHRDLKPSNVLVTEHDGVATPKIIDFGIAKATAQRLTERTLHTEIGQLVGTPEYMSPEQAALGGLDVDTRTDVYSLGTLLYEVLAGVMPFDPDELRRASFDELRRRIRDDDPPAPSARVESLGAGAGEAAEARRVDPASLARSLRGDRDWIVMKALEKDRERRYGSPAELAADIRRHLGDQPVVAGPPGRAYRLQKFVRRHRLAVAAAAIVCVAVVVGSTAAAVGFVRAVRAQERAAAEAARATRVSDFLLRMFMGFDPTSFQVQTPTARDVLDLTAERIETELDDQPEVRAQLQARLGNIYSTLGLYEQARPLLSASLATQRELLGAEHPDVAAPMADLAWLHYNQGDYEIALNLLERGLALREAAHGRDDPEVARYVGMVGSVLWRLGRLERARQTLERAYEMQERAYGPDDMGTINLGYELALVREAMGDWEAARAGYERTLQARLANTGPDNLAVAAAAQQLGGFLVRRNERQAGEEHLRHALRVREEALGPDHPEVAETLGTLAALRFEEGDYPASWALYRRIWGIHGQGSERQFDRASTLRSLAAFHRRAGAHDRARPLIERALEIIERSVGGEHPDYGRALADLAAVLWRTGEREEARSTQERALRIIEEASGYGSPAAARTRHRLGDMLHDDGDRDRARSYYERALAVLERAQGERHPDVAAVQQSLAGLAVRDGDAESAIALYRSALEIREAMLPAEHISLPSNLEGLATALRQAGELGEAEALEARAREIRDRHRRALMAIDLDIDLDTDGGP